MNRYLYLGSPEIAASILKDLCKAKLSPCAVVTQPARRSGRGHEITPTPVEKVAKEQGLPVFAVENINEPEVVAQLAEFKPDFIFVVAFGQILKKAILELPRLYCLNVHASLLPKYRGAAPVQWALLNGDTETGVTVQRIVKELDAGDVLLQKLAIEKQDTTASLWKKMASLGSEISQQAIELVHSGTPKFVPQDPSQVSFAPKIKKEQAIIQWSLPAHSIYNQVRAFFPWPVAQTHLGGKILKIYEASYEGSGEGTTELSPGSVVTDSRSRLGIACGDGKILHLHVVQLQNRRRLGIVDFLQAFQGKFPHSQVDGP